MVDQEQIRKRMSQIELNIDEMNHVIEENLNVSSEAKFNALDGDDVDKDASQNYEDRKETHGHGPLEEVTMSRINATLNATNMKDEGAITDVDKVLVASETEVSQSAALNDTKSALQGQEAQLTDTDVSARDELPLKEADANGGASQVPDGMGQLNMPKRREQVEQAPRRVPSNPFRVVSVSKKVSEGTSTQKLQARHDYLTAKCSKLQREIQYLDDLRDRGSLPRGEGKKMDEAQGKLKEYLDSKMKERYEIGVLLSRQLRREIDRGQKGQFWVGN
ncbi:LAMI_0B00452g1_1 [Lachancea mirantina]|uniref:LAMI_0B00452g1_1 n=1 Tax=Lachancea mirantina TaxID=1230905 RepID=A0A1G4IST2_9SACH|nr:LAMI_0B00452g1_1 [Lachancea mirantina]